MTEFFNECRKLLTAYHIAQGHTTPITQRCEEGACLRYNELFDETEALLGK